MLRKAAPGITPAPCLARARAQPCQPKRLDWRCCAAGPCAQLAHRWAFVNYWQPDCSAEMVAGGGGVGRPGGLAAHACLEAQHCPAQRTSMAALAGLPCWLVHAASRRSRSQPARLSAPLAHVLQPPLPPPVLRRPGNVYRSSVLLRNVSAGNASLVLLNDSAFALVGSASPDVPLLLPNGSSPGKARADATVRSVALR